MELRKYQQDLLTQVQDALADPKAGLMLQLPTGGGKTCIAAVLLADWLQEGRKAVWLTHRRELAGQTEEMLREAGVPASANILWTPHSSAPSLTNGAVILMAQTVSRRVAVANVWGDYDHNDLLIIDEAHHATAGGWTRAISQWPGPVLGMTATPWRLARNEGFEHLFRQLLCGPSTAALQADGWLCRARVIAPPEEEQIIGGELEAGDYSEAGIEQVNRGRDLWTAGAFHFWQKHGENRQTIIYAVSVGHARNLAAVFQNAGIATGVLLGDTPDSTRAELLYQFRYGGIRVLVNVAVATEGFDLPDAACVVLTRPTLSLALYLQMVGRGLRPKEDASNCVVLDLAGNSRRHGLPDQEHQWSLYPRGTQNDGEEPPVIRCPQCEELSPAASQQCQNKNCKFPFGERCYRCGAWRAWARWRLKAECPQVHDPVCDRCHYDAHRQANLPFTEEMRELAELQDDDELPPQRDPFLKNFLLEELQRFGGVAEQRKDELRLSIRQRDSALADDGELERLFQGYIAQLPAAEQPQNMPQRSRLYTQWETDLRRELAQWRAELAALESRSVDGPQVFDAAQKRLLSLLAAEGRELGLLTRQPSSGQTDTPDFAESGDAWVTFAQLMQWGKEDTGRDSAGPLRTYKPAQLQGPWGEEIPVRSWARLLAAAAEWLVREGLLTREVCPVTVGGMNGRYLVSETTVHASGQQSASMRLLSNGLYIELRWNTNQIPLRCQQLLEKFGQDPAQFRVLMR